jgi:hypothetical protein
MGPLPQVSGCTFVVKEGISTNVSLVRHKPTGEFPQAKIWKLDGPYFRG